MTIQPLQTGETGLVPQTEDIQYDLTAAKAFLTALAGKQTDLVAISELDFNLICEKYEGAKGIRYPTYDAISHELLRATKPQSNAEIFTIKKNGKIVAARFNTTSLKSNRIKNIFYFSTNNQ
jgi:hypothetical protein